MGAPSRIEPRENNTLLYSVILAQFAPPFMFSGVAVALPSLGAELQPSATSLGLVETLFLGGSAAFLIPAGRIADATDKYTLYKASLLGFALTSFIIAMLSSMNAILVVRLLQGMVSTFLAATGPAILAEIVPANRRGRAFGLSLGAIYCGLTFGPVIAGLLVGRFGWRAVFVVGGAGILCAFLSNVVMLKGRWRRPEPGFLHLPSILTCAGGIFCLIAGAAMVRHGALGYGLMLGAFCLGLVFVALQARAKKPLLQLSMLTKNARLSVALLVQMMVYVAALATTFLLSLYLQLLHGHSATVAGRILAVASIVMMVGAPLSGRLSDRFSPRWLSLLGALCLLLSTSMATRLAASTEVEFVLVLLSIQGFGFALFSSPNMTTIMNSVPPEQTSMASALAAEARGLGMVCGMIITTVFTSLHLGSTPVDQNKEGFLLMLNSSFGAISSLVLLAVLLAGFAQYRWRA